MPTATRVIDDHAELANILGDGSYHLSSAQRTAAIRDATNSQNGLMPTGKLKAWDAAYSHMHNLTTDIDHDALTNYVSAEHIDWTSASDNLLTSGTLTAAALLTTKINPTAVDDMNFFGDTDVGNNEDGKSVYIHRKAAEGDGSYRMYIDQYGVGKFTYSGLATKAFTIESSGGIRFDPQTGYKIEFGRQGRDSEFGASSMGSGRNPGIKHFGYITADTSAKYIQWKINDTTDWFELTKEDAHIDGFDVQMPLRCDSLKIDTTLTANTITQNSYFTINIDGTDVQVLCTNPAP